MALKVKAKEQLIKVGKYAETYRYVMMPELYTALTQDKVIKEAALRSGVSRGVMQACWDAAGEVISILAPLEQEGEVVRAIGVDGVLRQRALSPGVYTPYSMDVEVDVQIDKTAALDIGRMTGLGVKILLTIVPGTDAEGLEALNMKSALVVTYLEPTDITTIAIILRMDVLSLVFRERHLIKAEEGATLTVRIVLPRAATIVNDLRHIGRNTHPHANLWDDGTTFGGRFVVEFDEDGAIIDSGISHRDVLHLFPLCYTTSEACSVLVVVLGFPEVGLQRRQQHLTAIDLPRGEGISINSNLCFSTRFQVRGIGEDVGREHELLASQHKSLLSPGLVMAQTGSDIKKHLAIDAQRIVGDIILAGVGKAVTVDDRDSAISSTDEGQRLIDMLHLIIMRMRCAVGPHEAIDAEGAIVGTIAEISSIKELRIESVECRVCYRHTFTRTFKESGRKLYTLSSKLYII